MRKLFSLLAVTVVFSGVGLAVAAVAEEKTVTGDAVWTEVERESLVFPIAAMFEKADSDFARSVRRDVQRVSFRDVTAVAPSFEHETLVRAPLRNADDP